MTLQTDSRSSATPHQPRVATILVIVSSRVNALATVVSMCLFLGMLALVLLQIVARYLLSSPPSWTDEAARYLMVWTALLGATVAFHGASDPALLNSAVAAKLIGGDLARAVRTAAVFLFVVPVVAFSPEWLIRQSDRTTETIGLSLPLVLLIVPLSFAVVLLHAVAALVDEPREAVSVHESSNP
jgi:TRAP-type C4-dicarboxylate transport system permease small subunit